VDISNLWFVTWYTKREHPKQGHAPAVSMPSIRIVLPVLVGPALEPLFAGLGFRARALFSIIALQREIFQTKCNLFIVVGASFAVSSGLPLDLPAETRGVLTQM